MVHEDYPSDAASQAFYKALVGEDHLGFIVRAHIHIEHTLRHLIEISIPFPEHLDVDQLNYAMAIRITTSLGLNPRFKGPLRALGKLRNKFAHQLDAQISDEDAERFYDTFAAKEKQMIHEQYAEMRAQKEIDDTLWENRDAKDKITFYVVILRAALLAAVAALSEGPCAMLDSVAVPPPNIFKGHKREG
jgi:hypothetical protein